LGVLLPNASKTVLVSKRFWKHLGVLLLSLICIFSVKAVQNSENSQLPNASKYIIISENIFLVSGTLSYFINLLCHITQKRDFEG